MTSLSKLGNSFYSLFYFFFFSFGKQESDIVVVVVVVVVVRFTLYFISSFLVSENKSPT